MKKVIFSSNVKKEVATLFLFFAALICLQAQPVISIDNSLTEFSDQTLFEGSSFTRTFTVRNTGNATFTGQIKFQDIFGSGLRVDQISLTHNIPSTGSIQWNGVGNADPLLLPSSGTDYIVDVAGLTPNRFITFTEDLKVVGCVDGGNGSSIINIHYCNSDGSNCLFALGSTNADGVTSRLNQNITRPDPPAYAWEDLTVDPYQNCTYPEDGSTSGPGVRHRVFRLSKTNLGTAREVRVRYVKDDNTAISLSSFSFSRELTPGGTRVSVTPVEMDILTPRSGMCVDDDFTDVQFHIGDLSGAEAFIVEYDEYNCCPSNGVFGPQRMKNGLFLLHGSADCGSVLNAAAYPGKYHEHELSYESYYLQRPVVLAGPHVDNGNIPDLGHCLMPVNVTKNDLAFIGLNGGTGYDFSMDHGQVRVVLNYDYGLTYTGYDRSTSAAFPFSNYDFITDPGNENAYSNMHFRLETNPAIVWDPVNVQGTIVPAKPGYKEAREFVFDIGSFDWLSLGISGHEKYSFYTFMHNSELVYSLEPLCESAPGKSRYTVEVYWIPDAVTCPDICRLPLFSLEKDCAVMCPGCMFPGGAGDFCSLERITMGLKDDNNNSLPDDGTQADPSVNNNDNDPLNDIRINFGIIGDEVRLHTQYYLTGGGNACGSIVGPDDNDFGDLRYSYLKIDFPFGQYFEIVNGAEMHVNIYDHKPAAGDLPIAEFMIPFIDVPDILTIYPDGAKNAQYYFDLSLDNLQPYLISGVLPDRYRSHYRIEVDLNLIINTNEEYGDKFQEVVTSLYPYFSATPDNAGSPPSPALPQMECDATSSSFTNWPEYPVYNSLFNQDTKFLCEGYFGSFNLVGVYRTFRTWNFQDTEYRGVANNGCGKFREFASKVTIGKDIVNLFANEFRPAFPVTNFEFPVPQGYQPMDVEVYSSFMRRNPGSSNFIEQVGYKIFDNTLIPPSGLSSNGFTMYNIPLVYQSINESNSWQGYQEGDLISGDENTSYDYRYRIEYICNSLATPNIVDMPDLNGADENKVKVFYNNFPGTAGVSNQLIQLPFPAQATTPKNELELRNPGGTGNTISAFTETFSEDFILKALEDGQQYAAMHPFLTVEPLVPGEFVNLELRDDTQPLALNYVGTFGNKMVYTIDMTPYRSPDVNGNLWNLDRIIPLEEYRFLLEGSLICNNSDPNHNYGIKLGYGWTCSEYPVDLNDVNGACFYEEEVINVVPVVTGWQADFTVSNAQCDQLNFSHIATSNGGQITDLAYHIDLAPGLTLSNLDLEYGSFTFAEGTDFSLSPSIGTPNPTGEYTLVINNSSMTDPFMANLFGVDNINAITLNFSADVSPVCNEYSSAIPTHVELTGLSFCDRSMPILSESLNATNNPCVQYSATISGDVNVCPGTVVLTGDVTGGVAPYTFNWYNVNDLSTILHSENNVPSSSFLVNVGSIATFRLIISDANGCQISDDHTVNVYQVSPGLISGLNSTYCYSTTQVVNLTGSPSGGSFSGPGVSGSSWRPLQTGINTIFYSYSDGNGCPGTVSQDVMVYSLPEVAILGLNNDYCESSGSVTLTGSPAGGIFSGGNVTGNTFSLSPVGTYTVRYDYTDNNGCSSFEERVISINPIPSISVSGNTTVCRKTSQTLTATPSGGTPGYTYQWFADGVMIPGVTTSTYAYTAATLGSNTYSVILIDSKGCSSSEVFITVETEECCTYEIGDYTVECNVNNSQICVPLNAVIPVDHGIIGMDFCLQYDPNILIPVTNRNAYIIGEVVNHTGSAPPQVLMGDIGINTTNPGRVQVSIFYKAGTPVGTYFEGTGMVVCIPFLVKGGVAAGTTSSFVTCELEEAYTLTERTDCAEPGTLTVTYSDMLSGKLILWGSTNKTLGMNYTPVSNGAVTNIFTVNDDCSDKSGGSVVVHPQGSNNTAIDGNFDLNYQSGDRLKIVRDIQTTPGSTFKNIQGLVQVNGMDTYRAARISTQNNSKPVNFTCTQFDSHLKTIGSNRLNCPPSAYEMIAADVNMNGKVRANDITLIQQRIVKLISEYPQVWNQGTSEPSLDWRYVDLYTVQNNPEFTISNIYPWEEAGNIGYWRDKVPPVNLCLPIRPKCAGEPREYYSGILLGDLVATNPTQYSNTDPHYKVSAKKSLIENYKVIFDIYKVAGLPQNQYRIFVNHIVPNGDTLVAIDFGMDYDQSVLSVINLNQTSESYNSEMNMMWNNYQDSELYLTSYSYNFLPYNGTFYYFDVYKSGGMPVESDFGDVITLLNGEEVEYEFVMHNDVISSVNGPGSSNKPYLTITPNPGQDISSLSFRRTDDPKTRIVMYNTLGQIVREFTNLEMEGERSLQLEELASGSYVIIMYTGEEKYTRQFMIQK